MNKSLVLASLVAAVALAACGKKEEMTPPAPVVVTPPAPAPMPMDAASGAASMPDMGASSAMPSAMPSASGTMK